MQLVQRDSLYYLLPFSVAFTFSSIPNHDSVSLWSYTGTQLSPTPNPNFFIHCCPTFILHVTTLWPCCGLCYHTESKSFFCMHPVCPSRCRNPYPIPSVLQLHWALYRKEFLFLLNQVTFHFPRFSFSVVFCLNCFCSNWLLNSLLIVTGYHPRPPPSGQGRKYSK